MQHFRGNCWHCARRLESADYGREVHCPDCGRATHVCRNCRFYAPGRANECLEPLVERVVDKERANFCDYFDPIERQPATKAPAAEDLLKAAEDLFK